MFSLHSSNSELAIFEIPIKNSKVYMKVSRTPYLNEERAVVVVNSKKFLELWRNNTNDLHKEIREGNPELWVKDYKYKWAVEGFSYGVSNPVPLARVSCWEIEAKHLKYCLNFQDGITRTIWLLSNEAPYFPVECRIEQMPLLDSLAAYTKDCSCRVNQLLNG